MISINLHNLHYREGWLMQNKKNRSYLSINLSIYILIKLWSSWLYDCLFDAVRTNPGYGMATLIYNNLLNLLLGTVMLLRSS